jgi:hypothetical protein
MTSELGPDSHQAGHSAEGLLESAMGGDAGVWKARAEAYQLLQRARRLRTPRSPYTPEEQARIDYVFENNSAAFGVVHPYFFNSMVSKVRGLMADRLEDRAWQMMPPPVPKENR